MRGGFFFTPFPWGYPINYAEKLKQTAGIPKGVSFYIVTTGFKTDAHRF
jgi:hypothetical protein